MDKKQYFSKFAAVPCLAIALGLSAPTISHAIPIYGITANGINLLSFDSGNPSVITSGPTAVTGMVTGDVIEGIAFRTSNGLLYGASRSRLYTINPATAVATLVPGSSFSPGLSSVQPSVSNGNNYGADFNPVPDKLRVVSQTDLNLRIDPDTGMVIDSDPGAPGTQPDGRLAYAPTDPNVGQPVVVAAVAYTNDIPGATSTTAYAYDFENDRLLRLGDIGGSPISPNTGQLFTVGRSGVFTISGVMALDIAANGQAFATLRVGTGAGMTRLFLMNLNTGAASAVGTVGPGTIFIGDIAIPPAGSVQFQAATFNINESVGTATITATRINGSSGAISVNYTTADGTALASTDYTAVSGTLSWADGDSAPKTFTVPIVDDAAIEPNETVRLSLTSPFSGGILSAPRNATLIIGNDDFTSSSVRFSAGSYNVNEGAGTATITVNRTGGSIGAIAVDFATSNLTALDSSDYTATSGTINFADGDTVPKTFTVPIADDSVAERTETLRLTLSNPSGATLGLPNVSTLSIRDNEATEVRFNALNYGVNESAANATITVLRLGDVSGVSAVDFATADGTATVGSDYSSSSGTLNFPANANNLTFTVPIIDDADVEPTLAETVGLVLSNVVGATLGTPANSTLRITSND